MDARLPWHRRLAIHLHLLYCFWCRRYAAQLQFLRRATRKMAASPSQTPHPKLSPEAKERMRLKFRKAMDGPSLPLLSVHSSTPSMTFGALMMA